ncbi:MAG: helix-turn-helix domain-containing protein [Burkholderiales bacterium]|nr:helix-turn-helix domain-containing protein [Burkholderiales bacterium]
MQPVYFVTLPGVLLLDLAGAAEAFRLANRYGAQYTLRFIGPSEELCSSVGLALNRIDPLPDALPSGALVVIAGLTSRADDERGPGGKLAIDWLRHAWRDDLELMTICSGAILAGAAGLLDGRRCTTHHTLIDKLNHLAPKALVQDNRVFVIDGPIATSAGVTTGIDLALELISERDGPKVALEVAREMVVWLRRDTAAPQLSPFLSFRNHLHPAVHRVQDAISGNPARDWPVDELARIACVSPRHLARLFKEHTGIGPVDFRQQMQLAQAEPLLKRRDWSLERIAEASGFGSARDLRRVWLRHRGSSLHR